MPAQVSSLLAEGVRLTDEALERLLPGPDVLPHSIHRAMRHSVFAGGKRLRPLLSMEAARAVAGSLPAAAPDLGAAIEMLHTYSLIHDDLPALDNDDLRRGKPTCHVVFGDAIAILAGDALQTLAYQTLSQLHAPPEAIVHIVREISIATGTGVGRPPGSGAGDPLEPADAGALAPATVGGLPPGMIGGQVVDIESEHQTPTAELVESIHRAKTGALITVSIVTGGILAGATAGQVRHLRAFGERAGLAFQIVDDILDVTESSEALGKTAGKDTATEKATWPAVFGLEASREQAAALIRDAFAELDSFGPAAGSLKSIAQYLTERTH